MTNIKFRYFDGENWYNVLELRQSADRENYWSYIVIDKRPKLSEAGVEVRVYNVPKEKTPMWTGFEDRHGVEIYEGDVIETDGSSINRSVVRYVDGGFSSLSWAGDQGLKERSRIEVIGNIYELNCSSTYSNKT